MENWKKSIGAAGIGMAVLGGMAVTATPAIGSNSAPYTSSVLQTNYVNVAKTQWCTELGTRSGANAAMKAVYCPAVLP